MGIAANKPIKQNIKPPIKPAKDWPLLGFTRMRLLILSYPSCYNNDKTYFSIIYIVYCVFDKIATYKYIKNIKINFVVNSWDLKVIFYKIAEFYYLLYNNGKITDVKKQ